MGRLAAVLVLSAVALLPGCQASKDSTSANEGKQASGIPPVPAPAPVRVPEGATLHLVLETAISSATSRSGDLIVARLAEGVKVGERVVVPAGSEVRGLVTAAVPSGRVKGRARLAFDFDTLVLEGKPHSIGTRPVDITAAKTKKRDAATIGIGAGAGGILGAILDGKKGAGIGVLVGGATGTGVVLTTKGKEVALGAGTHVTVRLIREASL